MKKLCFYTLPFPKIKSYYDMIDLAAEYGFNAVEGFCILDFENPDEEAAKKIREYADSKNVVFPCFSVYMEFAPAKESIEKLKKYANVAKILGSPYLHHTIIGEFEKSDEILPYKDEYFKKGVEAVREIYDYAQSIGIKAIYEEQGYVFNGVREFGKFLDTVERNVGVVADFGNIYESADDLLDFIKAYGNRVVHAHIKDVHLLDSNDDGKGFDSLTGKFMYEAEPGKGIVKIKEAIDLLKSMGYEGYYGLEFGASDDNSSLMDDSIALIKSLM